MLKFHWKNKSRDPFKSKSRSVYYYILHLYCAYFPISVFLIIRTKLHVNYTRIYSQVFTYFVGY